jgi:hypothetical protein
VRHCIVYSRRLFTLATDSSDNLANGIVLTRSWNMMVSSDPPEVVVCGLLVSYALLQPLLCDAVVIALRFFGLSSRMANLEGKSTT